MSNDNSYKSFEDRVDRWISEESSTGTPINPGENPYKIFFTGPVEDSNKLPGTSEDTPVNEDDKKKIQARRGISFDTRIFDTALKAYFTVDPGKERPKPIKKPSKAKAPTFTTSSTSRSFTTSTSDPDAIQKDIKRGRVLTILSRGIETFEDYSELAFRMGVSIDSFPKFEDITSVTMDANDNIVFNFKPQDIEDDQKPITE